MFAWRNIRRTPWPIEPGLWLGAALGVRLALEILLTLAPRPLFQSTEVMLDAVTCLCLVTPLFGRDVPARWKTIVVLLITLYGLPLLLMGTTVELPFSLLRYGRPSAIIALLIAAAVADKYSGRRGTWLHNLGICVWIAYALFTIVLRLL